MVNDVIFGFRFKTIRVSKLGLSDAYKSCWNTILKLFLLCFMLCIITITFIVISCTLNHATECIRMENSTIKQANPLGLNIECTCSLLIKAVHSDTAAGSCQRDQLGSISVVYQVLVPLLPFEVCWYSCRLCSTAAGQIEAVTIH